MDAAPSVKLHTFDDVIGMPKVHTDERRTIYEKIVETAGKLGRTTRIVVTAPQATLGNHYHDFEAQLTGQGNGVLYTAPKDDLKKITRQQLRPTGWMVTIPPGIVHTLCLENGAVLIEKAGQRFTDGVNTHRAIIAP